MGIPWSTYLLKNSRVLFRFYCDLIASKRPFHCCYISYFVDYAAYSSPERLSSAANSRRVSFSGRLLHVRFTKDKYYNNKHICLWLSAQCIVQRGVQSDVVAEPAVIQVQYSSGRTVEWDASTLLAGQLLSMQDLVFDKGW